MLKKSKTAVLTALAVMLSAFSPLATYAENAEPVETIPDRNIAQVLNNVPEIHDDEPIQTTAVSTIPDRVYTCTSVPAPEIQPEEFPLERNFDVTVKVIDSYTREHLDGVKIHLVETETITNNIIKNDYGTWDSSESESYVFRTEHTFTNLSDLFLLTAVIEDMPEGYSIRGGSNVLDWQVDSAMDWYRDIEPRPQLTISLDRDYQGIKALCNLIDGDTGEYIEGAGVSLSEWDENGNLGNCVEWVTTGKEETIDFECKIPEPDTHSVIQFVVDKLPEKYNAYTYSPFYEKYIYYDSNLKTLMFVVSLYDNDSMTKCALCGKSVPSADAVKTPYNNFCKDCYAGMSPMTTTTTTTALICDLTTMTTTTTTTATVIACKACEICGDVIDVNDGVTTPLGLFVCPKCKSSGAGGTRPIFPTENTTTSNIIYGDANCDNNVTIADAVLIMQSIVNTDEFGLSENGRINADVYNTGDGVTSLDALTIQMININLVSIEELPIMPETTD
ncbi:MAG: dockerin type I repeat-containing protein [Ruminococcus sp.]|nr:dockerin type I repeat-containing protein [Ruminococcus sp.]